MKKYKVLRAVSAMLLALLLMTACGSKSSAPAEEPAEDKNPYSAEAALPDTTGSSETTAGDRSYDSGSTDSNGDGAAPARRVTEDSYPGIARGGDGPGGTEAAEEAVSKEELFAESIQEAVADKDMEGLADLLAFPCTLVEVDDEETTIGSRGDFLKLNPDQVFGEAFMIAVANVDTAALHTADTKVVMGEEGTGIIFQKKADGTMAIVEIHE